MIITPDFQATVGKTSADDGRSGGSVLVFMGVPISMDNDVFPVFWSPSAELVSDEEEDDEEDDKACALPCCWLGHVEARIVDVARVPRLGAALLVVGREWGVR